MVNWVWGVAPVEDKLTKPVLLPGIPNTQRPPCLLHAVGVTTLTLYTFTTTYLEMGKKAAVEAAKEEDTCESKLSQMRAFVQERRFDHLPFSKSADSELLRTMWEMHYLVWCTLLEHPQALDHFVFESTCSEVCHLPHSVGDTGDDPAGCTCHPMAAHHLLSFCLVPGGLWWTEMVWAVGGGRGTPAGEGRLGPLHQARGEAGTAAGGHPDANAVPPPQCIATCPAEMPDPPASAQP